MPVSHYRGLSRGKSFYLWHNRPSPIRIVHPTDGWPLIGHGVFAISNSRMTVLQMLVTERQPPLTLTHLRRNDQYLNSPYVPILH